MVGGFGLRGMPEKLIDALVDTGKKDLTIISNDLGSPNVGLGRLLTNGMIKGLIGNFYNWNKEAIQAYNEGRITVKLIPVRRQEGADGGDRTRPFPDGQAVRRQHLHEPQIRPQQTDSGVRGSGLRVRREVRRDLRPQSGGYPGRPPQPRRDRDAQGPRGPVPP